MTVTELLARLEGVKRGGAGWVAKCPGHDDRHQSLSIGNGSDGRVLLNCHAGCAPGDVAARLGVQLKDLFADERKRSEPEAVYDYRDERGRLLFQVVRFPDKQFRQRKPDGDGWSWKLGDVRRVLYRLPQIIASAEDDAVVYVCEGEKDAERLASIGLVATSNSGGAGKWGPEHSASLRGRDVVILPDNDTAGRDHAQQVARSLDGVALRVRVVELPGLPPKGDVSDWLIGRADPRAELERIVSLAPAWDPAKPETTESTKGRFVCSSDRVSGLLAGVRERAKSSQPFRVDFLDDIAIGILETDLIVLGAPTGAGKTTLAATFAQQAAANGARVDYFALEAHEDEIEQRMLFRLMSELAWKGKLAPHHQLERFTYARWCHGLCEDLVRRVERQATDDLKGKTRTLRTFYRDGEFKTDDLVAAIRRSRGEADLIILDHLHFLDDGSDDEVRAMGRRVKAVADAIQDARTPVIAIAHLRKSDTNSKRVIPHIAEFHGSSEITKIATKVITLAPVQERERSKPYYADTYMHASKDRLKGEENVTAILKFDLRSNAYARGYELGRLVKAGSAWEPIPIADLPFWAEKEARRHLWP